MFAHLEYRTENFSILIKNLEPSPRHLLCCGTGDFGNMEFKFGYSRQNNPGFIQSFNLTWKSVCSYTVLQSREVQFSVNTQVSAGWDSDS